MIGLISILAGALGVSLGIRLRSRLVIVLGFISMVLGIASFLVAGAAG